MKRIAQFSDLKTPALARQEAPTEMGLAECYVDEEACGFAKDSVGEDRRGREDGEGLLVGSGKVGKWEGR